MIKINLDNSFAPFGEGQEFSKFEFPSGCEPHIKLHKTAETEALITARIKNMNDFFLILLATDALRRMKVKDIHLFISYLPFARQDRVMVPGEPLSIKVLADLLNAQGFESVHIFDPHSEVSTALIDRSEVITNHSFIEKALKGEKDFYIVSPDAGAYKKIFKVCQHIKYAGEIVMCNKDRDITNGVIRSVTISHEDLQGKNCFIIDDICDGGGTFNFLAEELRKRNCGDINLIVSHGIFSKGLSAIQGINRIITTDSFRDMEHSPKLTQIKLCDILI